METGGGSARSAEKGCRPPPLAAVCCSSRLSVRACPQARQLSADATALFRAERNMSPPRRLDSPRHRQRWEGGGVGDSVGLNDAKKSRMTGDVCRCSLSGPGGSARPCHCSSAPAGTNHSSATVFPSLSAPHPSSHIVTTVAVCVCVRARVSDCRHTTTRLWQNKLCASARRLPRGASSSSSSSSSPQIGVTVSPTLRADGGSPSRLGSSLRGRRCWGQTMEALNAQARISAHAGVGATRPRREFPKSHGKLDLFNVLLN